MARLLFLLLLVAWTSGLAPSKRGQGYQISPRACSVGGHPGVCMFVWECIRHEGEHLGMCMDTFMFGSCCQLPANVTVPTEAALTGPSSAVSTFINQQQHATRPNIIPGRPSTKRPPRPPQKPTTEWFRPQYSTTERFRPQYSSTERFRPQYSSTERYRPTTERYRPTTERYRPTTERYRPTTERYRPTTERYRPSTTSTERHPSTEEHHTSESFQVSVSTSAESKSTERTPAIWGTTEPAFVTRTKPPLGSTTSSWGSSPFRPRPPDFVAGSLSNQQRPHFSKPTTPGYVTKKPSRPSSPSNEFITSSTKFPGKPGEITKRPITTPEPPALLDFVTLSTKRPTPVPVTIQEKPSTAVQLVRPTTVVNRPTSTSSPVVTTSKPTSTESTPPVVSSTTLVAQHSTRPNAAARKECGVPPLFPRPEMRIVGGSAAPFGGWPWQVSVRRTSFFGFSSTHRCGGAVLNENWIATAGHCVDDLLTSQIRIRVGEYDFSSAGEPLAHEERGVLRKVVHPRYNFFTYEYDLALVQLDKPLDFAPHVAPICLPGSDDSLVGETATVTGWGRLSEGGTLPSVLQEVSVPIVSNEKCKSMFLRAGRHEHIPEIFLCAGFEDGGRDSCQGDSGGPLQVRGKDGRYFLAGIISWGIGCAESNLPGVCTRISKFVPWIMENVT